MEARPGGRRSGRGESCRSRGRSGICANTFRSRRPQEGLNIKHDIAVPISRIGHFIEETDALIAQAVPGVRMVTFGHLGDGNLHYNVQAPEGVDPESVSRRIPGAGQCARV